MNEDEALRLLQGGREGVIEWNRRVAGGDKIPSLHGVNLGESDLIDTELQGACLAGANLAGADLGTATLVGADLRNADLHEADLSDASLYTADLTKANLEDADLSNADLGHANLSGANLNGADLEGADLRNANLCGADLAYADFEDANLNNAKLVGVDLSNATLVDCDLTDADLPGANLSGACLTNACLADAKLRGANLTKAMLAETDLSGADLRESTLHRAVLAETNLKNADLNGCSVHGMSAWDVELDGASQANLNISRQGEPAICVDGLDVARFLDMLIHKAQIRDVLDTITCKVVLILGSFLDERAAVLDAIREGLRHHDLCPVSFDSEGPVSPDSTGRVLTLARLARFVVADITAAPGALEEIGHFIREVAVPVVPLLAGASTDEPAGLTKLRASQSSILTAHRYGEARDLPASFERQIIASAEAMRDELRDRPAYGSQPPGTSCGMT